MGAKNVALEAKAKDSTTRWFCHRVQTKSDFEQRGGKT